MDGTTGDLKTDGATRSVADAGAPALPVGSVEQTRDLAANLGDVEAGREPFAPSRASGPNPLLFVLVLTGVVMVFAIIVAVWMYWILPTLPV